ncbi:MIP family Ig-specific serine endopeptidase [Mycoplasmopsis bovis]|uniref:MIP family Ig-specific serine endopeptidase n=1 Tax=Mycoplasmopsis bovis TaxID=28903 RepID=UPI003D81632B
MQTVDYVSAFKTQKHPNNLTKAKDVYIAGYPVDGKVAWWMQNNPSERYEMQDEKQNQSMKFDFSKFDPSKPFPILPHNFPFRRKPTEGFSENNVEEKITTVTPTIFDSYWGRVLAAWYGFQYNVNFSSLYYGASGSLAYNEYGQMIGIYNGVSSNVQFGDLLKNGSIAPFLQSSNIEAGENTIYAYNLIDGTNKTQFGMQKNSFRENLRVIYPNGFEDGSKETKLFDKGY